MLTYADGWTVTANGTLFSSADTLIETKATIPEPASLALRWLGSERPRLYAPPQAKLTPG